MCSRERRSPLFLMVDVSPESWNQIIEMFQDWATLIGGEGIDGLHGGAGSDVFMYTSTSESGLWAGDWIHDFTQGEDVLHLSGLASTITVIGTGGFSGTGGAELRQYASGSNTVVDLDVDGNATTDWQVVLVGTHNLAQSDIV